MRLTRDEILLIVSLLFFLLLGVVVKHYRDQVRLAKPVPLAPAQQ